MILIIKYYGVCRHIYSFPTRRSSDLRAAWCLFLVVSARMRREGCRGTRPDGVLAEADTDSSLSAGTGLSAVQLRRGQGGIGVDRKSTRLNSSHSSISYAVFFLNKKIH